ncbi:DUF4097 family beta strand repeat-containing protein [Streptomyces longispororuber]|uniref:DUF4097 family beta strand repeat-containing protein n=1 Tax=Streptomyces longispororuber TaxID=68230 RepID=UPI00210E92DC|nr:DUF4097 family beta strand repeat-containing protein [Streptomyces longispororuber]MCQ4209150.1 DUF4097 domain-containing protein [Streptomyces longispororuber]
MQKFDTAAPISTVLNVPAARVRFIAADRADTTVEVRPADAAKSRDAKAAELVEVAFADGVLRIETPEAQHKALGNSGSVEITVELPAGSGVDAKLAAGELRGVGRLGDVTVDAAQGPVALDEAAGAHLTLQDGDITVGRLTGSAELRTQRGDLTVSEAAHGTLTLHTEKGDITVGAAHGTSATLDARTGYGRVQNALKNADGADAGLNIKATTAYGDIAARSL